MLRLWSRAPSHGSPTVSVYNKFKFVRDKNNQNPFACQLKDISLVPIHMEVVEG